MDLFRSVAISSIRSTPSDLAHSALPGAPVQTWSPSRRPVRRAVGAAIAATRTALRLPSRSPRPAQSTAANTNVHCPVPIQARIGGWQE